MPLSYLYIGGNFPYAEKIESTQKGGIYVKSFLPDMVGSVGLELLRAFRGTNLP